ncbi:MAG: AAA family ATPase [Flavobacteriaceae bacterium]
MIKLEGGESIDCYDKLNVVLGKNGSGKSTLLRLLDHALSGDGACVRYITPERGGELRYDGNIDTNQSNNPNWLTGQRRRNRFEQFRQSSVAAFRSLETLVLRSIESDPAVRASDFKFDAEIDRINGVLDRVIVRRSEGAGLDIIRKEDGNPAQPADLSSGESELISLAVEILFFSYLCKQKTYRDKDNWLLLDEPDVHLHPDLQQRLMELLETSIAGVNGRVLIATHSTAILASLFSVNSNVRVGFKEFGNPALTFHGASDALKTILPMFGAHPLSNVFNQQPPLIVEGEDDERIWQAAVRRSEGRIRIYPCAAGDIQSMNEYEKAAAELMTSVYDSARAFSLRDRDGNPYDIDDEGPVIRSRLNCRAAENLLVTDDVLNELGTDWPSLRASLEKWIDDNPRHVRHSDVIAFRDSNWDRLGFDLKSLRMLLVGTTGSNKPWEVAVGQSIARLPEKRFHGTNSLEDFLGHKIVSVLRLSD